jgi:tetrahydromethanopterin S-methyltransferase subunit G
MELLMVGREAMMRTIEVAGLFKKTQFRSLLEAIINVAASVVFIIAGKHFYGDIGGIYGVLLGTIVALLYRTVDINLFANKYILKRSSWKTFSVMLTNAVTLAATAFAFRYIPLNINGYKDFLIYGLLITVTVVPVFLLIQSLVHFKECKSLLSLACSFVKRRR